MKTVHRSHFPKEPLLSIVLVDWSCREGFHTLHYLNRQRAARELYEIIWVEYYDREAAGLGAMLEESRAAGSRPPLDQWIVAGLPRNLCYHKHLLYNLGLIAARGEIVTFCDSDAIMTPAFVETIINAFACGKPMVLHMDEVRNESKRFYPFNYPPLGEILGEGCLNWRKGKTAGLLDDEGDRIHSLNYGACMSARRRALLEIGGADEHLDYLGHICGPYEMTFRLVNAGHEEIWHEKEFLYHLWHPGTDGKTNYFGPHDGRNMSTTALNIRYSGRVLPLTENPAVKALRLGEEKIIYRPLLEQAIPEADLANWAVKKLGRPGLAFGKQRGPLARLLAGVSLSAAFGKFLVRQFRIKVSKFSRQPKNAREVLRKLYRVRDFVRNMTDYYRHIVQRSSNCIKELSAADINEVAIYGAGDAGEIFCKALFHSSIALKGVYDKIERKDFFHFDVLPAEELVNYQGKIVMTVLAEVENNLALLQNLGVEKERIILL